MDRSKIEAGVRLILEGIGEDLSRDGLRKTPQRVARMYEEIFSGVGQELHSRMGFTEESGGGQERISVTNIEFHSVCEHHLLPFFGKVDITYIPAANRIAGFSDFSELVDMLSHRPQLQERMTAEIADQVMNRLEARGVRVTVKAIQLCASMRGPHKKNLKTVTEVVRGEFPAAISGPKR